MPTVTPAMLKAVAAIWPASAATVGRDDDGDEYVTLDLGQDPATDAGDALVIVPLADGAMDVEAADRRDVSQAAGLLNAAHRAASSPHV